VVMWFDEHNHPVEYTKLSPEQRLSAHRERCYKWVSLLHVRRGAYVYAGVALLPGNAHEVGPFFKLVEQFVQTAGKGVIKWLVLDRGFIDGEQLSRCQQEWGIEVVIPMKKNMDIWADAWALAAREGWQPVPAAPPPVAPIPQPARSACGGARLSGKRPWPKGSKPGHRRRLRIATPIASIAGLGAFAVGRRLPCPSRWSASGIIMPTDITKIGPS